MVNTFIDNNKDENVDDEEPICKKKKTSKDDLDDSLKFFKSIKPLSVIKTTSQKKSSATTTSSLVSEFIQSDTKTEIKPTKPVKKPATTRTRKTKTKVQPDIRKALSKHEYVAQYAINESCHDDNVDPFEMQLALAISESLKDQSQPSSTEVASTSSASTSTDVKQKTLLENPFAKTGKCQSVNSLLERYGFQSRKIYSEYEIEMICNSKDTKRTKRKKFPTLLTSTTQAEREEMIKSRIDFTLKTEFIVREARNSQIDHVRSQFQPHTHYLQTMAHYANTVFDKQNIDISCDQNLLQYYVTDLIEPSYVKSGHLLKDWKGIAGRDCSPEREEEVVSEIPTEVAVSLLSTDFQTTEMSVPAENIHEMPETSEKTSNDLQIPEVSPNVENVQDNSDDIEMNLSCSDIFEDIESFSLSDLKQDANECAENECISDQLSILNDILSQKETNESKVDVDNESLEIISIHTNESDSTIEYSIDKIIETSQRRYSGNKIDLTISEDNMQQRENQEIDEIDLTQHDDATMQSSSNSKSKSSNNSNEKMDDDNKSSQLMDSDEVIDISDDEVNYSIQNCQNYDLQDIEMIEIDNMAEQSLFDVMSEENLNRDQVDKQDVSNLLEDINVSVKVCMDDIQPLKVNVSNNLSSSILAILNKYKQPAKEESFNVDDDNDDVSQILTNYENNEKSEKITIDENDEEKEDSPKIIIDEDVNEFSQEIQSQYSPPPTYDIDCVSENENTEEFIRPIRKSLDNILNSAKKTTKRKSIRKKRSLGVNLDDKYIVDTESDFVEPNFSSLTPNELKRELYKFGIRTLPVKKAVELLQYIYDQMHPKIRVASIEEIDKNDSRLDMNATDFVTNIGIDAEANDFVFEMDSNGIVDGEEYVLSKSKKSKVQFFKFIVCSPLWIII